MVLFEISNSVKPPNFCVESGDCANCLGQTISMRVPIVFHQPLTLSLTSTTVNINIGSTVSTHSNTCLTSCGPFARFILLS